MTFSITKNFGGMAHAEPMGGLRDPETIRRYSKYIEALKRVILRLETLAIPKNLEAVRGRRKLSKKPREASHSISVYSYFFETFLYWLRASQGRELEPRDVTRAMAQEFTMWLATGSAPDIRNDRIKEMGRENYEAWLALGRACEKSVDGQAPLVDIWRQLSPENASAPPPGPAPLVDLDQALMVVAYRFKCVNRRPTATERRKRGEGVLQRYPLEKYKYSVEPRHRYSPSSLCLCSSIMSVIWKEMMKGENYPGGEALLQHNIWSDLSSHYRKMGRSFTLKHTRLRKLQEPVLQGLEQAALVRAGMTEDPSELPNKIIEGVRDLMVLYGFVYMGLRAEELCGVLRKDMSKEGDRVRLTIYGKEDETRAVVMAEPLMRVWERFDTLLDNEAQNANRAQAAWASMLRTEDAPIFPAYPRWGIDCPKDPGGRPSCSPLDPLNPAAVAKILKKLCDCVRVRDLKTSEIRPLTRGELDQVHPHGLRHYCATKMHEGGYDIKEIQEILGHRSILTTQRYVDTEAKELGDPSRAILAARAGTVMQGEARVDKAEYAIEPAPPVLPKHLKRPERKKRGRKGFEQGVEIEPAQDLSDVPPDYEIAEEPLQSPQGAPSQAEMREADIVELSPGAQAKEGQAAPLWAYTDLGSEDLTPYLPRMEKPLEVPEWRAAATFFRRGQMSYLPWWLGTTGLWRGAEVAPVISPWQASPATDMDAGVMNSLRDLWHRWRVDPAKGPTAAGALLSWIGDMLDPVSVAFDQVVIGRGAKWIRWSDGVGSGANVVREHLPTEITSWFDKWSDSALHSRSGKKMLRNADFELPPWFFDDDPVLSLPEKERTELREWLESMQGTSTRSTTMQSAIIETMVYLVEEYATAKKSKLDTSRPEGARNDPEIRADIIRNAPVQLKQMGRKNLQPPVDIDINEILLGVRDDSEETVRGIRAKVMAYLTKKGVAGVVVGPVVRTKSGVLEGKNLTFDRRGTIVHTESYKARFFENYGTDSECVARRAARWLWESRRSGRSDRPSLIAENFDMYMTYIVPCPKAIEAALVKHDLDPDRFDKNWKRSILWADAIETLARDAEGEKHVGRFVKTDEAAIKAMFEEFTTPLEVSAARMGVSFGAGSLPGEESEKLIKNADSEVPDPVTLMFAAKWRV